LPLQAKGYEMDEVLNVDAGCFKAVLGNPVVVVLLIVVGFILFCIDIANSITIMGEESGGLGFLMMFVTLFTYGVLDVWCAFSDIMLHSKMSLDPTHVRLKQTCV
jgi:membrane-bound ClpP family serine protease